MARPFLRLLLSASLALALAVAPPACADPPGRDHPLVGTWRFDYPDGRCREIYRIRSDGTSTVTSGEQVSETEVDVTPRPDDEGWYRWRDIVRRDNGRPDCSGVVSEVGHEVVNYLRFDPGGTVFVVCARRDPATCFGPFVRLGGTPG